MLGRRALISEIVLSSEVEQSKSGWYFMFMVTFRNALYDKNPLFPGTTLA